LFKASNVNAITRFSYMRNATIRHIAHGLARWIATLTHPITNENTKAGRNFERFAVVHISTCPTNPCTPDGGAGIWRCECCASCLGFLALDSFEATIAQACAIVNGLVKFIFPFHATGLPAIIAVGNSSAALSAIWIALVCGRTLLAISASVSSAALTSAFAIGLHGITVAITEGPGAFAAIITTRLDSRRLHLCSNS
jgi:hypothetical protein